MKRNLTDGFSMGLAGEEQRYPCAIPCSAMTVFLREGRIPDPFFGTNEYEVTEFLRNDFVLRGVFSVTEEEWQKEHMDLTFHCVDTIADLYLNGEKVGHMENMHRVYTFPCKGFLRPGENTLELRLASALEYIQNRKPTKGREITMANTGTLLGQSYLRKAHCMFGWDWGPILPDLGVYRPIELCCWDQVKLQDTLVRQHHEGGKVELSFTTRLEGEGEHTLTYRLRDPEGTVLYEGSEPKYTVEEPRLWWPNGYGEQPLYTLEVELTAGDEVQRESITLGLRTLTISQEEDRWGKEFAYQVNGKKIFARGADYIPDDCFYPNITREVLERDVRAAVFANFNSLRVWGGGYYPSDDFYELCDRYGIILWQDFMFACNVYDLTDQFRDNIVAEARDNLIRFRNHPCLGLICGNNEMEVAWLEWADMKDHAPSLKRDYLFQFELYLAQAVKEYAPDVFYWPSSPSSGGSFDDPMDENRGDSHYWDVWHGLKPYTEYRKHFFRFCSEFGFQSLPSIKTIRAFTRPEDRNLFSKVMESHQKNPAANGKILSYLSETFRYPRDLEQLSFLSQVMQGYAIQSGVEHWRRNRGRCMGSIYWQFNDNWPVASWSSLDYYGRYKALHYMARRFYAPVAGSIALEGKEGAFWLSNETLAPIHVTGEVLVKTLDFQVLDRISLEGDVPALSALELGRRDYAQLIKGREEQVFLQYVWRWEQNGASHQAQTWESFVPVKHLDLRDPGIQAQTGEGGALTLTARSFVPYCMVEGKGEDVIFDDNVFALTGEPVTLTPVEQDGRTPKPWTGAAAGDYTIYDVYHTYD